MNIKLKEIIPLKELIKMTNNLEKLTLRKLVDEIVKVEREYNETLRDIEISDGLVELEMGSSLAKAKEYDGKLKALYTELDRREKKLQFYASKL